MSRSSHPTRATAASRGFRHPQGRTGFGVPHMMERALAAYQRSDWDEADRQCRKALAVRRDHFDALHLCGVVASKAGRAQDAAELLARAVAANPRSAEAHNSLGNVLRDLARHDEALAAYDRAIALKPDYAVAHNNRGNALHDLKRHAEALECYDRAIALDAAYASPHSNRGMVLHDLHRYAEAVECYERALALDPQHTDAYANLGTALDFLKQPKESMQCFERALHLDPNYDFLRGVWLIMRMRLAEWNNLDHQIARLVQSIERQEKVSSPFPVLAMSSSAAVQRLATDLWTRHKNPPRGDLGPVPAYPPHEKIRIGYFSGDYHEHALSFLMAELFERHDKSRFVVTAFSFTPDSDGQMRRRLLAAFDAFIDVRERSDLEVARLAREMEIDIAVDLTGFTRGSRTDIFAYRAAPVQASYLGYLGTMGAEYMDYLIADHVIVPEESRRHYREKIVYLPSYQANDTERVIAERAFTRTELGLPETGFVFCCFNNTYKITPATFDGWMRILAAVEGSALLLLEDSEHVVRNLRKEALARGIDPARLAFAPRVSMPEYLSRFRVADLFLDTMPYNAGTTASDALWAGLPVLTCTGEAFASRVAASLLTAIHLPELITSSRQEYEALAIALAKDPARMTALEAKLAANRLTTPLFDIEAFTNHLEAAYRSMHERQRAGAAPDHIEAGSL